jgi:hypothetical protein
MGVQVLNEIGLKFTAKVPQRQTTCRELHCRTACRMLGQRRTGGAEERRVADNGQTGWGCDDYLEVFMGKCNRR